MKWYQNKYVQATVIAFATGAVAALLMYVGTITDGLDLRHTIKSVGLAFLGPFSILVTVLPKITDILTPTVRIVSQERVAQLAAARPETSITTNDVDTTVVIGEPPLPPSPNAAVINTQSYTPARRTREGNSIPVKTPPVKLT